MKKIKNFFKKNWKDIVKDIIIIAVFYFVFFYDLPYYIYKPGGIINVSERIEIEGIKSKDKGTYNLSYVSVLNGNIPNLLVASILKTWEIVPEKEITISGTDYEETLRIERFEYQNAIESAAIVAYIKAGYDVEIENTSLMVYALDENAKTTLITLDKILKIEDKEVKTPDDVHNIIDSKKTGDKVKFTVLRENKEVEAEAKIYKSGKKNVIGIYILEVPEFKLSPSIKVSSKESEAGSSGGLMTALAIYDTLVPEDITKGRTIVGTGTIDINGNVGAIGGIKYKLLGAADSGADIFFVPEENYKEAKKVYDKYKFDFELIKVKTFDEALDYLNGIK